MAIASTASAQTCMIENCERPTAVPTFGAAVADTEATSRTPPRAWGTLRWASSSTDVFAALSGMPFPVGTPVATTIGSPTSAVTSEPRSPLALATTEDSMLTTVGVVVDRRNNVFRAINSATGIMGTYSEPDIDCSNSTCVGAANEADGGVGILTIRGAVVSQNFLSPPSSAIAGVRGRAAITQINANLFLIARRSPVSPSNQIELRTFNATTMAFSSLTTIAAPGLLAGSPIVAESIGGSCLVAWIATESGRTVANVIRVASATEPLVVHSPATTVAVLANLVSLGLARSGQSYVLSLQTTSAISLMPLAIDRLGAIASRIPSPLDELPGLFPIGSLPVSHRLGGGAAQIALAYTRTIPGGAGPASIASFALQAPSMCTTNDECTLAANRMAVLCGTCSFGLCGQYMACPSDAGVDAAVDAAADANFVPRDGAAIDAMGVLDVVDELPEDVVVPTPDAMTDALDASIEPPADGDVAGDSALAMDSQIPEDSQTIRDGTASAIDGLRFKGGACACTIATHSVTPSRTGLVAALALALTCVRRRRAARLTA
ncbi:MAG: hypothetical protein Q8Q09_10020 [Deltaproteobacteria bacterium]|nr:hypothetical protein [Deltaproteobacteria bacterium]